MTAILIQLFSIDGNSPPAEPCGSQPVKALSIAHHGKGDLFQHHLVELDARILITIAVFHKRNQL